MKLSDFHKRVLTAIALLGVVSLIAYIDNYTIMWAFLGTIYMFGFYESMKLFDLKTNSAYFWAALLWIFAYIYPNPDDLFFLIAIIFGASLAYLRRFDKRLIFPFLYPSAGILFFLTIYTDYGIETLGWLLVVVASTDTFAFITGKFIGKTKFSDTSPNKTLEGVAGGVITATIFGTWVGTFLVPLHIAFIISLLSSIASVFGDLFESYLKRQAGVKDSGDLLPGHGGILDRIDGFIFAAPMMVITLRALV